MMTRRSFHNGRENYVTDVTIPHALRYLSFITFLLQNSTCSIVLVLKDSSLNKEFTSKKEEFFKAVNQENTKIRIKKQSACVCVHSRQYFCALDLLSYMRCLNLVGKKTGEVLFSLSDFSKYPFGRNCIHPRLTHAIN